ncbi:helix-turn-helix transcriptional regulator [Kamptonema sp. UHCC 0994]|uniref:helix-turn-helix transcriptional regulator n=1 Tax=Kamptonema sp. UHCC 0994 TaxID=3031329 RepID=UPI0023BB05DF|nr:helix-turn-helix transcriptional regulator [Kamptonema sp. UHCC 0994]MDF0556677.1 helix-turn-helix transcriptional regulator [Kamptonema sp. UHCC 0994]
MKRSHQQSEQPEEGSPLKTLREELDLSQEQLARIIGVSSKSVSNWERGVTPASLGLPQIKALNRLLKSKGKSIEELPDSFGPPKRTGSSPPGE